MTTSDLYPTPRRSLIWWWFLLSSLVVTWDIGFVCLRPRSMPGGDLHWIWKPYANYVNVDLIYGFGALESHNGFTMAQTVMNMFENALNFYYCYLGTQHYLAPLVGFTAASLTLAKTMLYVLQDYYCGWCSTGHNPLHDLIFLWIIPNGFWIVVPAIVIYTLGGDLVRSLRIAANVRQTSKAA